MNVNIHFIPAKAAQIKT